MIKRIFPVTILLLVGHLAIGQYMADNARVTGVEGLYEAGERAYRSGDNTAAITLFDQVLEQEHDHVNALLQRGFCHSLLGAYADAIADFSAVIERKNDHIWAYTSRGSAYNKLGKHDLAIADFNTVLTFDPKNEEAYNNRGWAHKAAGDAASACNDWKASKRMGNAEAKIILTNNRCK
jgi:tetratricopeptide (TPR) repeat protein